MTETEVPTPAEPETSETGTPEATFEPDEAVPGQGGMAQEATLEATPTAESSVEPGETPEASITPEPSEEATPRRKPPQRLLRPLRKLNWGR